MIPMGRTLCLPSPATVQELFSVARDASIIPDVSLDPVLTTFLSLDSSAALQHQYASLQRGMSGEQQAAFSLNLTGELGGSSRVPCGGVGVVALALSVLFEQVAHQVRAQSSTEGDPSAQSSTEGDPSAQRSRAKRIFGISSLSRIGWIIHSYLRQIPGVANNQENMAEATELHDNWLKLELLDHYERMTTKKRMSSESMQQWLAGAAFHLHMRIHQVRLNSVPLGSAESLRLSYRTAFARLVQGYTAYLHRNIQETPGAQKPRSRTAAGLGQTNTFSRTNMTCLTNHILNDSLVNISTETATPNSADTNRSCKTDTSRENFGRNVSDNESGYSSDGGVQGLLVIEPCRNVSHHVQHHPCESPAIQQALVTRIINAQDLERNRNFFQFPEKVLRGLLRQRDNFELKTNQAEMNSGGQ